MAGFWQALRSGSWVTQERMRNYALIFLGISVAAMLGWIVMANGLIDRNGKPIGTDFSNVYAAGALTLQGHAPDAYNPVLQHDAEKAVFDNPDVPFFGWHYPPFFLMIAAALACLPYALALLAWLAISLPAYLSVIHAIVPRRETWLMATAFPAVLVNAGHGQNGFFTAALLGGFLLTLERRPILAGVLLGLLSYKPQFGVLIPLVLLATGRWTTLLSAAATVAVLVALSTALFSLDVWHAFAEFSSFTKIVVLENGGTGWHKIQSLFSAVRMWGGSVEAAYIAQGALALALAASLIWLWRSPTAFALKAAALAIACLLATPYVLDYDLVVLGVAIAFMVKHGFERGFRPYDITLLAAAWIVPVMTRSIAQVSGLPLGLIVMTALYILVIKRAAADLAITSAWQSKLARA